MASRRAKKPVLIFAGANPASSAALTGASAAEFEVDEATLQRNLRDFIGVAERLVGNNLAASSHLTEYSVQVGINAKGKVGFLGVGGEIGASASLTLKFSLR